MLCCCNIVLNFLWLLKSMLVVLTTVLSMLIGRFSGFEPNVGKQLLIICTVLETTFFSLSTPALCCCTWKCVIKLLLH